MEKFEYKAKDIKGRTLRGKVEATDTKQAAKILQEKGLVIISLKIKRKSILTEIRERIFTKVGLGEKVNFTRQLSTMITAGLKITEALSVLESQASPGMRRIIGEVLRDVEGGKDLASSLEKHPAVFDQVYIALIRAGEAAGVLENTLARLANNLEKQKEFQSRIKGAMIYPVIIITGMLIVAAIMVIVVIPKMTILYQEFQANLPAPTRILLGISKFVTYFWWIGLGIIGGLIIGINRLFKNYYFRKQYQKILLRIPIFGNLIQKSKLTDFTRTLGILIGTGVLISDALKIACHSLGNIVLEEAVQQAAGVVERGLPLSMALADTEVFPPLLSQMVSVGEETGKLDEVLEKVSSYFEQESETLVKNLTTAMEPIIMIILGIGVAFLMVSVIMPIYNLTSQF